MLAALYLRQKIWLILIIAALIGGSLMSIRQATLANNLVISLFNQKVEIVAEIRSDPLIRGGKVFGSTKMPDQQSFLISVQKIDNVVINLPMRMLVPVGQNLHLNQQIKSSVKLIKSKEAKVAALAVAASEIEILAQPKRLFSITDQIRSSFRSLVPKSDLGSLIPGLILGDTSLQSEEFTIAMRRVGFSHLTAVSGANFALVAGFVLWLMQYLIRSIRTRLIITAIVLILFIFLVRPTPSVLRAAVMTAVLLAARYRGDNSLGLPALGAAIGLLVLLDPFQAIDPGFALSVLATGGILFMAPHMSNWLAKRIKWSWLAEAIAIPISATLFCTPVVVALSGQLSLITVPANILASPVIGPITVIGFVAALFAAVLPNLSSLLLLFTYPMAGWIVWLCNFGASFAVLKFSSTLFFIALLLIFTALFLKRKWRPLLLIAILLLSHLTYTKISWPGSAWQIANCDVGQGDALVINLKKSDAIVIDVGPEPSLIDNCLRRLGVKQISLLVLTHFHADHVAGLAGAIKNRDVKQVWITNNLQPTAAYESSINLLDKTTVRQVVAGEQFQIADKKISVLWPERYQGSFASLPGDGSAINNSSIALLIKSTKLSIFASGDLEPPVQELLTANPLLSPVDIYKVAHHGSAYQYLPMLDKIKPSVAVISVGDGNNYGHPSPELIGEFEKRGVKVLRTDKSGGIAIAAPNKIRVTGKDWWRIRWG
jgi:competence protein ComEC